MSDAHVEKATELLVNYLQAIAAKAGMKWDPDYTAEIRQAVEEIVAAAREPILSEHAKAVADLRAQIEHVEEKVDQPDWRQRQ